MRNDFEAGIALLGTFAEIGLVRPFARTGSTDGIVEGAIASIIGHPIPIALRPSEGGTIDFSRAAANVMAHHTARVTGLSVAQAAAALDAEDHREPGVHVSAIGRIGESALFMYGDTLLNVRSGCEFGTADFGLISAIYESGTKRFPVTDPDRSFLDWLEVVRSNPHEFTVRDILDMVESRQLLRKLADIEHARALLDRAAERRALAKDSLVWLLGFVPFLDQVLAAVEWIDLLRRAHDLPAEKATSSALLYGGATPASGE